MPGVEPGSGQSANKLSTCLSVDCFFVRGVAQWQAIRTLSTEVFILWSQLPPAYPEEF